MLSWIGQGLYPELRSAIQSSRGDRVYIYGSKSCVSCRLNMLIKLDIHSIHFDVLWVPVADTISPSTRQCE